MLHCAPERGSPQVRSLHTRFLPGWRRSSHKDAFGSQIRQRSSVQAHDAPKKYAQGSWRWSTDLSQRQPLCFVQEFEWVNGVALAAVAGWLCPTMHFRNQLETTVCFGNSGILRRKTMRGYYQSNAIRIKWSWARISFQLISTSRQKLQVFLSRRYQRGKQCHSIRDRILSYLTIAWQIGARRSRISLVLGTRNASRLDASLAGISRNHIERRM